MSDQQQQPQVVVVPSSGPSFLKILLIVCGLIVCVPVVLMAGCTACVGGVGVMGTAIHEADNPPQMPTAAPAEE